MTFAVSGDGQVTPGNDVPSDEDRRKAKILANSGGFAPDAEELFARGIAVARNGGDVRAFLREQVKR